jgi:DNA-binding LacI/PurR family transcriptional regulator
MHMAYPIKPSLDHRQRIRSSLRDLTGVRSKTDEIGIEQVEQQVEMASQVLPPNTTMVVDKVTMGRTAVQRLSYRIAWRDAAIILIVLRAELI